MKTMKPILGIQNVVVLDATKKGTEDRFTIIIEMKVKDSERTFKDAIFYDVANTARANVVPAILCALADQTGLPIEEFRTEDGDSYDWDEDKVLKHIKGKEITVERTTVVLERNGQTYYNVNYRPEVEEEGVVL